MKAKPLTVRIPTQVVSEANRRDYWAVRFRRGKAQKEATLAALAVECLSPKERQARFGGNIVVRLTRIGGRVMDDDNLANGFKAIRDAVASWLGRDDGEKSIAWSYGQRKRIESDGPLTAMALLTIESLT